jgi:hypothetical protein
MLGISGQKIAPALCTMAGASGASAFLAGIAGSDFIVAINHDPAAPVFAAADVGIVGDVTEVLEALAEDQLSDFASFHTSMLVVDSAATPAAIALRASSSSQTRPPAIS